VSGVYFPKVVSPETYGAWALKAHTFPRSFSVLALEEYPDRGEPYELKQLGPP